MPLTDECKLKLADDVTFQSMGDGQETVLLSLSSGYLYTCNDTTESFLRALDGQATVGQILTDLAEQYDVSLDRLRRDIIALVQQMLDEELILLK